MGNGFSSCGDEANADGPSTDKMGRESRLEVCGDETCGALPIQLRVALPPPPGAGDAHEGRDQGSEERDRRTRLPEMPMINA